MVKLIVKSPLEQLVNPPRNGPLKKLNPRNDKTGHTHAEPEPPAVESPSSQTEAVKTPKTVSTLLVLSLNKNPY